MNHFSGTVSIDNIISQLKESESRTNQLKQLLRNEKNVAVQDINRQIENKKAIIAKFNDELETLRAKLKQLNDLTPEPDSEKPAENVKTDSVTKEAESRKVDNSAIFDIIKKLRDRAESDHKAGTTPIWPETDYNVYKLEDLIPGSLLEKFKNASKNTKQ